MQHAGFELRTAKLKFGFPTTGPFGNLWYFMTLIRIYNIIFIYTYWKIKMLGRAVALPGPKGAPPLSEGI
jgi:hypothetical protein